ncbi:DUF6894 family protein [Methylobacterium longum]|uniref:DUF6894 family protein n=1 Tax=Methylobacterium longum TaxID=767694 RepID=UPI003F495E8A
MPRYYFHIQDGKNIRDDEGTQLPGLSSARDVAIRTLGELLRDGWDNDHLTEGLTMHVVDEGGIEVITLHVSLEMHKET